MQVSLKKKDSLFLKWPLFIHSTTPYMYPRLDFRIEPKIFDCCITGLGMGVLGKVVWTIIKKKKKTLKLGREPPPIPTPMTLSGPTYRGSCIRIVGIERSKGRGVRLGIEGETLPILDDSSKCNK